MDTTERGLENGNAPLAAVETVVENDEMHLSETVWGGMRVGVERYHAPFDDAPLLVGLPDDRCQCPHWGYLLSGRLTVRYADREQVVEEGEVYYAAPGHTVAADAGTMLVEFSPVDEFRATVAVTERNAARMAAGDDA
jgi:hypothetical protein